MFMAKLESGTRIKVTVAKWKKKRSDSANAYYWGVVIAQILKVFVDAGNNMDGLDLHRYLKREVGKLSSYATLPSGEVIEIEGGTKKMSTAEFMDYLEKCRFWALETLELNIDIPGVAA